MNPDGYEYATITGNVSLDYGSSGFGTYNALRLRTNSSPQYASSNTVQMVFSDNPPSTAAPGLSSLAPNIGQVGAYVTIIGSGLGDARNVTFNGVSAPILSASATNLSVQVPAGATTGNVFVTNPRGVNNGLLFMVGNPPATSGWCNISTAWGTSICGTQSVAYTTAPRILLGQRAPREGSPVYNYFLGEKSYAHVYRWEYNYSGNADDWHTIAGPEGRDFQPWNCWQTVYYRRVTLEQHKNMWGQVYHDDYETSNAVKITPSSPPPTPTQSTYYACANTGSTFTINFTPGEAATSSSWSLPADTWRVNGGRGVNYQYSHNVGAVTSVTITVPAGVPAGRYEIHTTSYGPGGSAGHRSIPLVVGQQTPTSISGPTATRGTRTYNYRLDNLGGSNFVWSATHGSITQGQGTNAIEFTTPWYSTYLTLSVNFTDICGNPASATLAVRHTLQPPPCRTKPCPLEPEPEEPEREGSPQPLINTKAVVPEPGLYPNPASTEVIIATGGHPATATIRDYLGVVHRSVELRENNAEAHVDVKDLPEGIYNVRIVGKDQKEVRYKLQIRR